MVLVVLGDVGLILIFFDSHKKFETFSSIARALRILRAARLVKVFKSFKIIMSSSYNILPSIYNVLGLLGLITYVYACLGIQLFSGESLGKNLTSWDNFKTFEKAFITMIKFLSGEDLKKLSESLSERQNCIVSSIIL